MLLYKYQLGELLLVASSTQEMRADTPLSIAAGAALAPEQYEKILKSTDAAIVDPAKVDVRHIGGTVASMIVAPISAPGDRLLGLIEFVNVEEAFDDIEKDFAQKLAAHIAKVLAVASLWGATSTPLSGVHQLPRLLKMTISSKEKGYETCGDAVMATCDYLQTQHPDWHLYVMFLSSLVDGERWDDRSRICDPRVASFLAPLENVLVVEVSIREADWEQVGVDYPLANHPRWMVQQLPVLAHYERKREGRMQELRLKKPGAIENLDDFVRCTMTGQSYENRRGRGPRGDWSLLPIAKPADGTSKKDKFKALVGQLQAQRSSKEQLDKYKEKARRAPSPASPHLPPPLLTSLAHALLSPQLWQLDDNIAQLERMLSELGPESKDPSREPSKPPSREGGDWKAHSKRDRGERKPRISFTLPAGKTVAGENGGTDEIELVSMDDAKDGAAPPKPNGNHAADPAGKLDGSSSAGKLEEFAQRCCPSVHLAAAEGDHADLGAYSRRSCPALHEAAGSSSGAGAAGATGLAGALAALMGGKDRVDAALGKLEAPAQLDAQGERRFQALACGALQQIESRLSGAPIQDAVKELGGAGPTPTGGKLSGGGAPDEDGVEDGGAGPGTLEKDLSAEEVTPDADDVKPRSAGGEANEQTSELKDSARQRAKAAGEAGSFARRVSKPSMDSQWQNGEKPEARAPTEPEFAKGQEPGFAQPIRRATEQLA